MNRSDSGSPAAQRPQLAWHKRASDTLPVMLGIAFIPCVAAALAGCDFLARSEQGFRATCVLSALFGLITAAAAYGYARCIPIERRDTRAGRVGQVILPLFCGPIAAFAFGWSVPILLHVGTSHQVEETAVVLKRLKLPYGKHGSCPAIEAGVPPMDACVRGGSPRAGESVVLVERRLWFGSDIVGVGLRTH
jgi:hypothetical protein